MLSDKSVNTQQALIVMLKLGLEPVEAKQRNHHQQGSHWPGQGVNDKCQ